MQKKLFLIPIICILLTACGQQKESNTLGNVEDIITTAELETSASVSTTTSNESSDPNDMSLCYYLSDNHFYDQESIDFYATTDSTMNYNVKILDAFTSDNLADGGTYFTDNTISKQIEDEICFLKSLPYLTESGHTDISYLFLKAELTNLTSEEKNFCIHDLAHIVCRYYEPSMTIYGVSDKRIESTQSSEILYDYNYNTNLAKNYYYIDIAPNQSITTTILYLIPTDYLTEELYMKLNDRSIEVYDSKLGRWMPTEDDKIRYLRIHLD